MTGLLGRSALQRYIIFCFSASDFEGGWVFPCAKAFRLWGFVFEELIAGDFKAVGAGEVGFEHFTVDFVKTVHG